MVLSDISSLKDFGLCSFSIAGGRPSAGMAIDGRIIALSQVIDPRAEQAMLLEGSLFDILQRWSLAWPLIKQGAADFRGGPRSEALRALSAPVEAVRLHAPIDTPRTIFCAGSNYWKHVIDLHASRYVPEPGGPLLSQQEIRARAEVMMQERMSGGEPFFFNKNITSLTGPFDDVPLPAQASQTDWELELTAVIGKRGWCVSQAEALDHVAGYAIGHDLSNRDRLQRPGSLGLDFLQAKGLDHFFPFGPYLVPSEFVPDPQDMQIVLKLNGETMQNETTSDMIYSLRRLIEYLSTWLELQPGDIIATGSPAGNGGFHNHRYLRPGDVTESSITGLGTQVTHYVPERPRP